VGVIGIAAVLSPEPSSASGSGMVLAPEYQRANTACPGADPSESGGLTDGVSGQILGLWIDLVRQGESATPVALMPNAYSLSRLQLVALSCLQAEGLTMGALARTLSVSNAVATTIADRLISAGAALRYRDNMDRRLVRLVATDAGVQMVRDHRRGQVAILQRLLDQMAPARQAVLTLAMKELAGTVSPEPWVESGRALALEDQRWILQ
jgi:DNA-binding MarR family transcriptional regulator